MRQSEEGAGAQPEKDAVGQPEANAAGQPEANAAGQSETGADVPYADVQAEIGDDELKTFTWRKDGRDWIYSGTCPRCQHDVSKRFIAEVIQAFQETEGDVQERTMRCDCSESHVGREAGTVGCGAWWGLSLSPQ